MNLSLRPENRFDAAADAYLRARPPYPVELVDWLLKQAGIAAGERVLDVAAGTGELTARLTEARLDVVATEPSRRMRNKLADRFPGLEILPDVAERLSPEDGEFALLTAANAMHWFDRERALPEFARVLRPGGHLAVIWQLPDQRDPLQRRLWRIVGDLHLGEEEYPGPTPGEKPGWEPLLESVGTFTSETVNRLPRELLPDYVASWSPVANMDPEAQGELLAQVRGWTLAEVVELPFRIEAELGRVRST